MVKVGAGSEVRVEVRVAVSGNGHGSCWLDEWMVGVSSSEASVQELGDDSGQCWVVRVGNGKGHLWGNWVMAMTGVRLILSGG
ncbi:hypothetical protein V6N12_012888 [Hibiscus sabdariffa]|uniref:Uncharacterized protein n=1 Tax=Hibiscus sabdariffa TaxID=183260 RepID=A0ABR2EHC0_9ROSI